MSDIAKLREIILEKEKEGKVVFAVQGGLMEADIMDFINQPTEGLLYDLNRDKPTVMTFINDPKWINDYAVGLVISKLKEFYDKAR
jgi:hypothetical protein